MESMRPVTPCLPPAPYLGGKRNLAKRLIERIEKVEHTTYVEPFLGLGGVFFRRRAAAAAEVINDASRDVSNLFRILQRHYIPFVEMMRFQLTTRMEFERLTATDADTLTDLERAARFLYLQRTTFGGKVAARTFGISPLNRARFDVTRVVPMLEDIHARLAGVVIECLPYQDLIERYDRPTTLFYLDPPYHGCERDYGGGLFSRADFARLATILDRLKGRFILSINDVPDIRKTFRSFNIERVDTTYSVGGGRAHKRASELIITGPTKS